MHRSMGDIRRSLPADKNAYDLVGNTAAFFLARPLSYPLTWLCLRLHVTANFASMISIWLAFLACLQVIFYSPSVYTALLVFFWLVLDCVDGNIARVTKTGSAYGEFLDALGSYALSAFLPVALGVATGQLLGSALGALAAIFGILPRLLVNKRNTMLHEQRVKSGDISGSKAIAAMLSLYNLSGVGLFILLAACVYGKIIPYLWLQVCLGAIFTLGAFYQCRRRLLIQ